MPVKLYKKNTAGRRISSVDTFEDITCVKPVKALVRIKKKWSGRCNSGKITVRHQGAGARRFVRLIDWKQEKRDIPAIVKTIEYDPNRGARIALVTYKDGEKRYVLAPHGMKVGDVVLTSAKKEGAPIKVGNRMPLEFIPISMGIFNIELDPGKGGQMVRGAGNIATLVAVEGEFAMIRLPSGEIRRVLKACMATIGQVSNPDWGLIRWGKAGRMRHRGIRPSVRGKAMNPVDHPHGGGEAKNSIGLKHPKTPTGKPALGVKTRRRKASDAMIISRRAKKKR
ncbi:MAG: 50S ribosomal protein L2 [Patescibacteria group bacterium]